jgi:hypothetical protein
MNILILINLVAMGGAMADPGFWLVLESGNQRE